MIEHITLTRCDRCADKIAAIEGIEPEPTKELAVRFVYDGDALAYTDLCPRCRKLVKRCWRDLQPTDGKRKAGE